MASFKTDSSPLNGSVTRESVIRIDRASTFVDAVLAATPLLGILFNLWLGSLTPVVVIGGVAAFVVLRYERVPQILMSSWPLLLLPIFCLASASWSQEPGNTLYYGTLYFVTVISAVLLGAGAQPLAVLKGVFSAFSFYTLCSVMFGRWVLWNDGDYAYAGLAGSKNAAGDTAALTILLASTMLVWALARRRWAWVFAALATLPLALYCLVFSRATGVLIATMISLPCLLLWIYSRRMERQMRVLSFAMGLTVLVGLVATSPYWIQTVFDFVLAETGKDAGLTGRALLWRVADDLIARNPWLGTGYNAFWIHGNLDAERLWREMGISTRQGFNFHNTPRDILVDLGMVGLGLFVSVFLISVGRLVIRTMITPTYLGILCCTLAV